MKKEYTKKYAKQLFGNWSDEELARIVFVLSRSGATDGPLWTSLANAELHRRGEKQ